MSGLEILVAVGVPAVVAALWFSHRFGWWRGTVDEGLPRILMYHMVREHVPGSRANKMRVRPADFEKQVRWLKENGWEFVTVSEIVDRREGRKRVAITFDDGYRDNLVHALPILQKHDAKMTLYLVADRESCPDWPAQRRVSRAGSDLSREERLTDDDVRELAASGLVELGSHTLTHVDLTQVDGLDGRAGDLGSDPR
jgi:peptidoglycan/xylan/chitin deacetylase (PgdA/CDA1 family)